MKCVVVVLSLLVSLTGAYVQIPDKCCVPDQFSAVYTDMSTLNADKLSVWHLQYDYLNRRQVALYTELDPVTNDVTVTGKTITDFSSGITYVIVAGQCHQMLTTTPFIQCIPDDATYMGSDYLGPLVGGVEYDGWRYKMGNTDMVVTSAAARNSCIPVGQGIWSPSQNYDYSFLASSFVPELVSPDHFDLPVECYVQ